MDNYQHGNFYRICERSGFKVRANDTIKEWNGLIVRKEDYEERHPQDFVRGRKDKISAPDPRPDTLDSFIGPLMTNVTIAANAGETSIDVESSVRFLLYDLVGIVLNDGGVQRSSVSSIPSSSRIVIADPLSGAISVGNVIINYTAVSQTDLG